MLTQEYLKSILHYDPETGIFTRLVSTARCVKVGDVAGNLNNNGYRYISISGKLYREHRIAFLYMTGEMPKISDHINRIRSDNRWCNLRQATRSQNGANSVLPANNTSGYKGVYWYEKTNKWRALIRVNGELKSIGYFYCKHEAFCEYVLASRKYFREFSAY